MHWSTVFIIFMALEFLFLAAIFEDRIRDEWRQWRAETRTVRCSYCERFHLEQHTLHLGDGDDEQHCCQSCYSRLW